MVITEIFVAIACLLHMGFSHWVWTDHGNPPLYTGLGHMRSKRKHFGVGDGRPKELYWDSSHWLWADYGHSGGLWNREFIASEPCVLQGGKIFVISSNGRLFERYWTGKLKDPWIWEIHGEAMGNIKIQSTACTGTTKTSVSRIFVVGINGKLYERYWSWRENKWVWRDHGTPPATSYIKAIDSCNLSTYDTFVYVIGGNNALYYRHITYETPEIANWGSIGSPPGKGLLSLVTSSPMGIFIATSNNNICEYRTVSLKWFCYGEIPGSSLAISKAYKVIDSAKIYNTARVVLVYSWEPWNKIGRLFSLKITPSRAYDWTNHGYLVKLHYTCTYD